MHEYNECNSSKTSKGKQPKHFSQFKPRSTLKTTKVRNIKKNDKNFTNPSALSLMCHINKLGIVLFMEEGIKILEYDTHLRVMFRILRLPPWSNVSNIPVSAQIRPSGVCVSCIYERGKTEPSIP